MLSGLLKRLMFARQFSMIDGKINILEKRFIMVPEELFFELIISDEKYSNEFSKKFLNEIINKIGSNKKDILSNLNDIFGLYGLGNAIIKDINYKKKGVIIDITNIPGTKYKDKYVSLASSILTGYFSVIFEKKVSCKAKLAQNALNLIIK